MFKFIIQEDVPCWYELSYSSGSTPRLVIRIVEDFLRTNPLPVDAPIFRFFDQEFKFPPMQSEFGKNWGFGGCLKFEGSSDGFQVYSAEIPRVRVVTGKCKNCKGSGRDQFRDGHCFFCNGKGKEHEYQMQRSHEICASLAILFEYLGYVSESDTGASRNQLLTVSTTLRLSMHGGSLSGHYSRILVDWMSAQGYPVAIPAMEQAMREAWERMMGADQVKLERYYFRAQIDHKNGWLNVTCPGNACGLNPNHLEPRPGRGYEFSCHNVDSSIQQLTLLASLGALHDVVRKEVG